MADQVVTDLRAAADYIDEHGWIQREYEQAGAVCALGALRYVTGKWGGTQSLASSVVSDKRYNDAKAELSVCVRAESPMFTIVDWNDRAGQTQEQVTGLMRRCADRLEGGADDV